MSLMGMFGTDEGARTLAAVAKAAGTDPATARTGLDALCPAIAGALQAQAGEDPGIVDELAGLLADNSTPDMAGAEAIVDGKAMLTALYGNQKAAQTQLAKAAPGLPATVRNKLAPIAAVTVVAAVAAQSRPMGLTGVQTAMGNTAGKIAGTLITAIITSAIQGVIRQLASPRSYRTTPSRTTTRKATTRSASTAAAKRKAPAKKAPAKKTAARKTPARRTATTGEETGISLQDILGGLFGNRGKQE